MQRYPHLRLFFLLLFDCFLLCFGRCVNSSVCLPLPHSTRSPLTHSHAHTVAVASAWTHVFLAGPLCLSSFSCSHSLSFLRSCSRTHSATTRNWWESVKFMRLSPLSTRRVVCCAPLLLPLGGCNNFSFFSFHLRPFSFFTCAINKTQRFSLTSSNIYRFLCFFSAVNKNYV